MYYIVDIIISLEIVKCKSIMNDKFKSDLLKVTCIHADGTYELCI